MASKKKIITLDSRQMKRSKVWKAGALSGDRMKLKEGELDKNEEPLVKKMKVWRAGALKIKKGLGYLKENNSYTFLRDSQ